MASASSVNAGEAWVSISIEQVELQKGLAAASAKINEFAARMTEVEKKLSAKVTLDISPVETAVNGVRGYLSSIEKALKSVETSASSFFINQAKYIAAHGAAILASAGPYVTMGDKWDKMSQRTAMSSEWLSRMAHAANLCGSNVDALENSVKKMQENMLLAGRGNKEVLDTLKEVGIEFDTLKRLTPEGRFEALRQALQQVHDPFTRAALAMKLFGEQGRVLMPLIAASSSDLDSMTQEADRLGLTFSQSASVSAAALCDTIQKNKDAFTGLANTLGGLLSPALTESLTTITDFIVRVRNWIGQCTWASDIMAQWSTRAITMAGGLFLVSGAIKITAGIFNGYVTVMGSVIDKTTQIISTLSNVGGSFFGLIGDLGKLSSSYETMGAASNRLLTALNLPIDSRANQIASGLLLMSNAETAAAAKSMIAAKLSAWGQSIVSILPSITNMIAGTNGMTLSETLYAIAVKGSAMVTGIYAAAKSKLLALKSLLTLETLKYVAAATLSAIKTGICAAAQTVLALTTKGLAAAYLALNAAMSAIGLNPWVAVIMAITAAVAGLCIYLTQAADYTAKLSREEEKAAEKASKGRKTDNDKFTLLSALSEKGTLDNKEMKRASALLNELKGKYGDIGISIDANSNRILKSVDAQEKFNAAIRREAEERTAAELRESEKNMAEIQKEKQANRDRVTSARVFGRTAAAIVTFGYVDWADEANEKRMAETQKKENEEREKQKELRKKLTSIRGGDTNAALGMSDDESLQKEIGNAQGKVQYSKEKIAELDRQIAEMEKKNRQENQSDYEKKVEQINAERDAIIRLIQTRLDAEKSKPFRERDQNKIAELTAGMGKAQKDAQDKIDALYREKTLAALKTIRDTENKYYQDTITEGQKKIDKINEETTVYKKQLIEMKKLIQSKKDKSTVDLQNLQQIENRLRIVDRAAAAKREKVINDADLDVKKWEKSFADKDEEQKKHEDNIKTITDNVAGYKKALINDLTLKQQKYKEEEAKGVGPHLLPLMNEINMILSKIKNLPKFETSLKNKYYKEKQDAFGYTEGKMYLNSLRMNQGNALLRGDMVGAARIQQQIGQAEKWQNYKDLNKTGYELQQAIANLKKMDGKDPNARLAAMAKVGDAQEKYMSALDKVKQPSAISDRVKNGLNQVESLSKMTSGNGLGNVLYLLVPNTRFKIGNVHRSGWSNLDQGLHLYRSNLLQPG